MAGARVAIKSHKIVLFDGECMLCDRFMQFIWKYDRKGEFYFAELSAPFVRDRSRLSKSIIYMEYGKVYTHSTAVLKILRGLHYPWKILGMFEWVPRPIRDLIYRGVAAIRYKIFGRRNNCVLPSLSVRKRFIDSFDETD